MRVSERGFYDGAAHRQSLTSAYNQYTRCSADPVDRESDEALQMLLRALFITSFMLADFLQDNAFFGAQRLVVSSASSKTAYCTAFCLPGVDMIALTSPLNRAFVDSLGCYKSSTSYADLEQLPTDTPVLYVDFSGDEDLRARVHHHFGAALVYDCYAGSAQNTNFLRKNALPGPAPTFYFAPVQIKKRNADRGPGRRQPALRRSAAALHSPRGRRGLVASGRTQRLRGGAGIDCRPARWPRRPAARGMSWCSGRARLRPAERAAASGAWPCGLHSARPTSGDRA